MSTDTINVNKSKHGYSSYPKNSSTTTNVVYHSSNNNSKNKKQSANNSVHYHPNTTTNASTTTTTTAVATAATVTNKNKSNASLSPSPKPTKKTNRPSMSPKKRDSRHKKTTETSTDEESSSSSSSEDSDSRMRRVMHYKKMPTDYKSVHTAHVYAGPTFNNSPSPQSIPMPAFGVPSLRNPSEVYAHSTMNHYHPVMMKSAYEMERTNDILSEIQRGLCTMLKIES